MEIRGLVHSRGLLISVTAGLIFTIALLGAASARGALTAQQAIAALSAQRADNKLPAGISERADWSSGCAKHNAYVEATGILAHEEDPGSPHYTPEGAFAGKNSVLSPLGDWDWEAEGLTAMAGVGTHPYGNPWESAPIHLAQVLAPALAETGYDDDTKSICAVTFPGYTRPDPTDVTAYSYPGDGRTAVPFDERATETPFVPGDFVGLPEKSRTGPYLMVFLDGAGTAIQFAALTHASLTGPDGPVAIRSVDSTHPEVGPYLPRPMAFLIPEDPLSPLTTYAAEATLSWSGGTKSIAFSFTTGSVENAVCAELEKYVGKVERSLKKAKKALKKANTPTAKQAAKRAAKKAKKALKKAKADLQKCLAGGG